MPLFLPGKKKREEGEEQSEKEAAATRKFAWAPAVVPFVGPFTPKTLEDKNSEMVQAEMITLAQQGPTSERRILKEVLGSSKFRQLVLETSLRKKPHRESLLVLSPVQLIAWGAALPGKEAIQKLHIEGPIPNVEPRKLAKKIPMSKRPKEINPKLPKLQPKDLERVLYGE